MDSCQEGIPDYYRHDLNGAKLTSQDLVHGAIEAALDCHGTGDHVLELYGIEGRYRVIMRILAVEITAPEEEEDARRGTSCKHGVPRTRYCLQCTDEELDNCTEDAKTFRSWPERVEGEPDWESLTPFGVLILSIVRGGAL